MIEGAPLPDLDADSAPYWTAAAQGELRVQQCSDCGRLRFPPRPMCPRCQSFAATWELMSGRGTIWSYAVPHPPLLPAFQPLAPYPVVVVALDEDREIRMVGNLLAHEGAPINSVDPASIRIGEAVIVVFDRVADDLALPRWIRAE